MKIIKKNQIIIYTLALMLVTAGYLNYTNNVNQTANVSTIVTEKTSSEVNTINNIKNDAIENDVIEIENAEGKLVENADTQSDSDDLKDNQQEENEKVADIGDATLVSSSDVVEDYFAKSKLERENMYSQMFESYEKILNNTNSTDEQKQSVTEEIKNINKIRNSIMICENLIKTKGFENVVVFVNGESVSIIVGAQELKTEEIAQIQNIISRELNVEIENIHISVK